MSNHFWQCSYCLMIAVTLEAYNSALCGVCGSTVLYLGKVQGDKLLQTVDKCPCDGRCTGAKGPNCDCQCNGDNHGTGRLVSVTVEVGKAPKLTPKNTDFEEAAKRASEYKAARLAIKEALQPLYNMRDNKVFIPRNKWLAMVQAPNRLNKIAAKTNHKGRIAALEELHKELTGA